MASATTDRRIGLTSGVAIKTPVDCATTANITLSGEQTIDGVTTSESRVLVKNQATASQNGIYDSSSAAWTRAVDANGNRDLKTGTLVLVNAGTVNAGAFYECSSANPVTIGSSAITWVPAALPVGSLAALLADTSNVANGDALIGVKLAATSAVGRTQHDKNGDILTDTDFGTLQAAVTAAAGKRLMILGTWSITSAISVLDNTEIVLCGGATVTTATADISIFTATGKTGITISGPGSITKTVNNGTVAYTGGVKFTNCTNCKVIGVKFVGMQYSGVFLDGCTACVVSDNNMTAFLGTLQDAADVSVYGACIANTIADNYLYGECAHGIMVQDPYAGTLPQKNLITGNRIGQHTAYGVAVYVPGSAGVGDTYNQIIGNYVENIQGSYSTNRSSGAGIYVVGAWAGSTQIVGNTVYNCCVQTLDRALSPAGIGVNGIQIGVGKPVISGNTVIGMTQGDGILVTSCPGGAEIIGNVVTVPSTNNGTGVGGATLTGSGVRVEVANDLTVTGGNVIVAGTGSALFLYANGANLVNPTITGGEYATSGAGAAIRTTQVGGFTINGLSLAGLKVKASNAAAVAVQLASVNGGVASGVTAIAGGGAGAALDISACTQLRISGGSFTGSTTANINTAGTCTGSFVDKAAYLGTSTALIVNGATGLAIEWRNNAVPATGTWAVGDGVQQSVPVVGQPKGWRCTVAGAPGTWVSEGNL